MLFFVIMSLIASPPVSSADINLKGGSYLRLRHEYWRNWKDMNNAGLDNRNFFRIKASLWGKVAFDENDKISLFAKVTDEFRAHTYFGGASGSFPDKSAVKKGYHFDINEIVFDNLYLDAKQVMELPVDLRIGRQDLIFTYGEGFLIMDGTPQDGSRTFYFNAAKASWAVNETNTLDFLYINNPRDEEFLPAVNRTMLAKQNDPAADKVPQQLNTTDEQGLVLYLQNKDVEDLLMEGYYIFKREDDRGGTGLQAEKGKINTLGSFCKYDFSPYTLRGQLAFQFGDYGTHDRSGVGGYFFLDNELKDRAWKPKASVGYIYLSGDDKDTSDNEAWDPLFSRWPWMSELYLLSLAVDTGVVGYWTNLSMYRTELVLNPTEKLKIAVRYNFLRANEETVSNSILSGTGKTRGHLPQLKLDYAISKDISTYVLAEYLLPGDFYNDSDDALFLRCELSLKF